MSDTFWIEFRQPTDRTTTRYESDDLTEATFVLQGVVLNQDAKLIDYSYSLDGSLDETLLRLDSVQVGYPVKAA
jgi:hypothetical protein